MVATVDIVVRAIDQASKELDKSQKSLKTLMLSKKDMDCKASQGTPAASLHRLSHSRTIKLMHPSGSLATFKSRCND